MIPTYLAQASTQRALHTDDPLIHSIDGPLLITGTQASTHGSFKTASRASAGTTIIVEPILGGSIVLTDLIVTTDKVNNATLTIQFTDGTNTIIIAKANVTDAPANFAISFGGLWHGWEDARVEMVTVNAVDATVALGYFKSDQSMGYSEWDDNR